MADRIAAEIQAGMPRRLAGPSRLSACARAGAGRAGSGLLGGCAGPAVLFAIALQITRRIVSLNLQAVALGREHSVYISQIPCRHMMYSAGSKGLLVQAESSRRDRGVGHPSQTNTSPSISDRVHRPQAGEVWRPTQYSGWFPDSIQERVAPVLRTLHFAPDKESASHLRQDGGLNTSTKPQYETFCAYSCRRRPRQRPCIVERT